MIEEAGGFGVEAKITVMEDLVDSIETNVSI
jgi:hypothetical protein